MNKWLELIMGLILMILPIYLWIVNLWEFGDAALVVLKGGIVWGIIIVGLLLLILGISDLKE